MWKSFCLESKSTQRSVLSCMNSNTDVWGVVDYSPNIVEDKNSNSNNNNK